MTTTWKKSKAEVNLVFWKEKIDIYIHIYMNELILLLLLLSKAIFLF